MGPKQGPKPIQAENDEITKLEGRLTKFLNFQVPGSPFRVPNGVQNGGQNGVSTLKASESLLTGILEVILALLEPSWALLDTS